MHIEEKHLIEEVAQKIHGYLTGEFKRRFTVDVLNQYLQKTYHNMTGLDISSISDEWAVRMIIAVRKMFYEKKTDLNRYHPEDLNGILNKEYDKYVALSGGIHLAPVKRENLRFLGKMTVAVLKKHGIMDEDSYNEKVTNRKRIRSFLKASQPSLLREAKKVCDQGNEAIINLLLRWPH